jgi:hypothetical protein
VSGNVVQQLKTIKIISTSCLYKEVGLKIANMNLNIEGVLDDDGMYAHICYQREENSKILNTFGVVNSCVLIKEFIFSFRGTIDNTIDECVGSDYQAFFVTNGEFSVLEIKLCKFLADVVVCQPFVILFQGKVTIQNCVVENLVVKNTPLC